MLTIKRRFDEFGFEYIDSEKDVEVKSLPSFPFRDYEALTSLYYYGARYLDPTGAMWLSVDPLFEKYVGMNPYGYCAGNPVKFLDPDGREFTEEAEVKTDEEEAHARGALFRAGSASVDLKMYPNVKTKEMHINKHIQEQINYFNKNNPDKPIYQNEIYRVP